MSKIPTRAERELDAGTAMESGTAGRPAGRIGDLRRWNCGLRRILLYQFCEVIATRKSRIVINLTSYENFKCACFMQVTRDK
jgi:hypothetical protein